MYKARIAVFASGDGSNFENLALRAKNLAYEVVLLITDRPCKAEKRAAALNIKCIKYENNQKFIQKLRANNIDFIALAGFLSIIKKPLLQNFVILNLHPSLLPDFRGLDAIKRAFENKDTKNESGISIHIIDSGIDTGEVIFQKRLKIGKNFAKFHTKIKALEHKYYPVVLEKFALKNLKLNLLIIGNGGRENALSLKIAKSKMIKNLYITDDGSLTPYALKAKIKGEGEIIKFCQQKRINLVIIGGENSINEVLSDALNREGIATFAPSKRAFLIEESKIFAKRLMQKSNISTADFVEIVKGYEFARFAPPYVIKYDGLCGGKGCIIAKDKIEAKKAIAQLQKRGKVFAEEFIKGEEFSVIAICNGDDYRLLQVSKDYKKRSIEDNRNTGGMGAYSDGNLLSSKELEIIKDEIFSPILLALKADGREFRGFLYAGIIRSGTRFFVLEFNARLGDPETQVILENLKSDFLRLLIDKKYKISSSHKAAICVVLSHCDYPSEISSTARIENRLLKNPKTMQEALKNAKNTKSPYLLPMNIKEDGKSKSGRVICAIASGEDISKTRKTIYDFINSLKIKNLDFRNDIGL